MLNFEYKEASVLKPDLWCIINDEITGVVVNHALTSDEVIMFKNAVEKLKPLFEHDLNAGNGYSLPGMFGQLHKTQPELMVDDYFNSIESFIRQSGLVTGNNVAVWLYNKLNTFFQPFVAECLPDFLPFSFRVVFPKRGGLFVHKDGKLLPFIHDVVSEKIKQHIRPETMMSWYFTLQNPEEGGELWVAHSRYANYEKEGQLHMVDSLGNKIEVDKLEHLKVNTPTGSLLMFKGGSYWHKVIPPSDSSKDRITLGGFMAMNVGGDKIFYWS